MPTPRLLSIGMACLFLLLMFFAPSARPSAAAQEPVLAIPSHIVGQHGQVVQVPIDFSSSGHAIAGTAFSIDFDESCLAFNTADDDHNGVPDGVHIQTPAAFRTSVSVTITDTDGEVDVTVADFSPPFATLPEQTLLTLDFTIICSPAADETRTATVGFSTLPRPSFSDTDGRDVSGRSQGGGVDVLGVQVVTPTVTRLVPGTPTATTTPPPAQTTTVAVSPTPVTTPTVLAPTPTATPTARATGTATPVANPYQLYIPSLMR